MTDAIFGWITGNEFCKDPCTRVYVNSLSKCGFEGDKIIFTSEMPDTFRSYLNQKKFIIVDVPKEEVFQLYRDRHLAYYKWLTTHQYRYILLTDARDTFFQSNPSKFLEYYGKDFLLLVGEGFAHVYSPINLSRQAEYQAVLLSHKKNINEWRDWQVINGGTVAGTQEKMFGFNLAMWLAGTAVKAGNQCALNYMYHTIMKYDPRTHLALPFNRFCLTGEAVNVNKNQKMVIDNNGQYVTPDSKQPYYLFHQWDRTPFAKSILSDWS